MYVFITILIFNQKKAHPKMCFKFISTYTLVIKQNHNL